MKFCFWDFLRRLRVVVDCPSYGTPQVWRTVAPGLGGVGGLGGGGNLLFGVCGPAHRQHVIAQHPPHQKVERQIVRASLQRR